MSRRTIQDRERQAATKASLALANRANGYFNLPLKRTTNKTPSGIVFLPEDVPAVIRAVRSQPDTNRPGCGLFAVIVALLVIVVVL